MSKKNILFIITVLLLIGIIVMVTGNFNFGGNNIKTISTINGYDYELTELDSKTFTNKFNELKRVLENKPIEEEKYQTLIAEMFTIDLFTLDTKVNKYDVGGVEYFHKEKQKMFKTKVIAEFYDGIKDSSTNNRDQELPEVTSTEVLSNNESLFKIGTTELQSYEIIIKLTYKKDLGYDTYAKVILVKNNNKYEVVEFTSSKNQPE